MAYKRDQWIASFEGQMSLLRPHLTSRVLDAMSATAWTRHGIKDVDPIEAARAESKALDQARQPPRR